jgi:hypothetical protein
MDRRTDLAGRRTLPHHRGDEVVIVTDEDLPVVLAHSRRVVEPPRWRFIAAASER